MKYLILSILLFSFNLDMEKVGDRYHEALINDYGLNFNGEATNPCLAMELQSCFSSEIDNVNAVYLYSNTFENKENLYVFKVDGTKQNSPVSFAVKVTKQSFDAQTFETTAVECQLGYCRADRDGYCYRDIPLGIYCGCLNTTGTCDIW